MEQWNKCNTCKRPIAFGQSYWGCSVSTCNTKRNTLRFCSVDCFTSHIPIYNHRDAWALERKAPTKAEYEHELKHGPEKKTKARPKTEETPKPKSSPAVIRRKKEDKK